MIIRTQTINLTKCDVDIIVGEVNEFHSPNRHFVNESKKYYVICMVQFCFDNTFVKPNIKVEYFSSEEEIDGFLLCLKELDYQ